MTLIGGLVLQFLFPIRLINNLLAQLAVGVPIMIGGMSLRRWVFRTASRARANLNPHSDASSLIVDGAFQVQLEPLVPLGHRDRPRSSGSRDTLWLIILQ